ncbi:hypothetical protein V6Z11_D08G123800 [Gossypium hirsutum]
MRCCSSRVSNWQTLSSNSFAQVFNDWYLVFHVETNFESSLILRKKALYDWRSWLRDCSPERNALSNFVCLALVLVQVFWRAQLTRPHSANNMEKDPPSQ